MSNTGQRQLSYRGTRAGSPVNVTFNNIPPTPYDNSDALYSVGDEWVYTNPNSPDPTNPIVQIYKLISLAGNSTSRGSLGHWVLMESDAPAAIFFQTNDANQATPNPAGVLQVIGDGTTITTTSVTNQNVVTISLIGTGEAVTQFTCQGGVPSPIVFPNDGNVGIAGGANITTYGTPNEVTIDITDNPVFAGTVTGGTGLVATTGNITATAGNLVGQTAVLGNLGWGVVQSNATGVLSVVTPGAATLVLTSNGLTSAPSWQAAGGGGGGGTTSFITTTNSPAVPTGGGAISFLGTANTVNTGVGTVANFASTDGTTANTVEIIPGIGANLANNGKIFIGGSGGGQWATITAGTGIAVANASGSITITNTGAGGGGLGLQQVHTPNGTATLNMADLSLTFNGTGGLITTSSTVANTVTIGQATNPTISGNVTLSGLGSGLVLSTSGLLSVSPIGTANTVPTSNGAGGITWTLPPGAGDVQTVAGLKNINVTGSGINPIVNLNNWITWPAATDATHSNITINSQVFLSAYGTNNTFLGSSAGNMTLTTGSAQNNTAVGANALNSTTTSFGSTCVGFNAGTAITTAGHSSIFGNGAGAAIVTAGNNSLFGYLSGNNITGAANSAFGNLSLNQLTSGTENCAFGSSAGFNYVGAETNNICIGYNVMGTAAESNTIRIGNSSHTATYIKGIYGVSPASPQVAIIDSAGQLGSSASTLVPNITQYEVLMANGASAPSGIAPSTAGYVLTSNGAAAPTFQLPSSPYPELTSCLYYQTGMVSNVTGDGTIYNLGSLGGSNGIFITGSIGFDVGAGAPNFYGGNGAGSKCYYKAPSNGIYQIIFCMGWTGSTLAESMFQANIATPYANYPFLVPTYPSGFTFFGYTLQTNALANLSTNDEVSFNWQITQLSPAKDQSVTGLIAGSPPTLATYVYVVKMR